MSLGVKTAWSPWCNYNIDQGVCYFTQFWGVCGQLWCLEKTALYCHGVAHEWSIWTKKNFLIFSSDEGKFGNKGKILCKRAETCLLLWSNLCITMQQRTLWLASCWAAAPFCVYRLLNMLQQLSQIPMLILTITPSSGSFCLFCSTSSAYQCIVSWQPLTGEHQPWWSSKYWGLLNSAEKSKYYAWEALQLKERHSALGQQAAVK